MKLYIYLLTGILIFYFQKVTATAPPMTYLIAKERCSNVVVFGLCASYEGKPSICEGFNVSMPNNASGFKIEWGDNQTLVKNGTLAAKIQPTADDLIHEYDSANTYNVKFRFLDVNGQELTPYYQMFDITVTPENSLCPPPPCTDFPFVHGKTYLLSAWVKEESSAYAEQYTNAGITLKFTLTNNSVSSIPVMKVTAGEPMIDGWQKITQTFVVPSGANALEISLTGATSGSNIDIYYDDIRIHPEASTMKSFVYNPYTLKLMAVLDENNYATLYEYDQEGNLTRVKKETERGILTVQESITNVYKRENK